MSKGDGEGNRGRAIANEIVEGATANKNVERATAKDNVEGAMANKIVEGATVSMWRWRGQC